MIETLFGKTIYSNKLDVDTTKIISTSTLFRKSNNIHRAKTDKQNLHVLNNKKLCDLKDIIVNELYKYLHGILNYTNEFYITTSWFTEVEPNEESQFHNHTNSFVSGVLYLQTTDKCGDIIFRNFSNERFDLEATNYNILNSRAWSYKPENGLILIFPSELYHKVEKNKSKEKRHSLAFNVIPKGTIGSSDGDSHMIIK